MDTRDLDARFTPHRLRQEEPGDSDRHFSVFAFPVCYMLLYNNKTERYFIVHGVTPFCKGSVLLGISIQYSLLDNADDEFEEFLFGLFLVMARPLASGVPNVVI